MIHEHSLAFVKVPEVSGTQFPPNYALEVWRDSVQRGRERLGLLAVFGGWEQSKCQPQVVIHSFVEHRSKQKTRERVYEATALMALVDYAQQIEQHSGAPYWAEFVEHLTLTVETEAAIRRMWESAR